VKAVEQDLHVVLAIEVHVHVGMAVSGQELLDTKRSRAVIRGDEHDVSGPSRAQLHPAEDQGPHEDVAQLAVRLHERQEMLSIDFDDLARLADTESDERRAA
jgi:hypothetical protein